MRPEMKSTQNQISIHHQRNSVYIVSEVARDKRPIKQKPIILDYTCEDASFHMISFRVVFTLHLPPKMKFHFCQNDSNDVTPATSFISCCIM